MPNSSMMMKRRDAQCMADPAQLQALTADGPHATSQNHLKDRLRGMDFEQQQAALAPPAQDQRDIRRQADQAARARKVQDARDRGFVFQQKGETREAVHQRSRRRPGANARIMEKPGMLAGATPIVGSTLEASYQAESAVDSVAQGEPMQAASHAGRALLETGFAISDVLMLGGGPTVRQVAKSIGTAVQRGALLDGIQDGRTSGDTPERKEVAQ